jgi:uncharacterized protein YjlB
MAGEVIAQGPPVTAIRFADDGRFPNNRLPLLHYAEALRGSIASSEALEALLATNGWQPRWRATIFTYHHFHSTAHEVLGIASGTARLMLGGPLGTEVEVTAGDVVVIPAGVGHCRLSSSPGFLVVGGYPPGQSWDLLRGDDGERPAADSNIAAVPMPKTDPVFGSAGPLLNLWPKA